MSYNNGFTVPTLSLTNSRGRKQHNSIIPTRDYSQMLSNYAPINQNDGNVQNKLQPTISNNPYTQPQKYRRPHIFPPKAPNSQKSDVTVHNNADYGSKDLNKNVYLQSRDTYTEPQFQKYSIQRVQPVTNQQIVKSSSKRGLLSNPISSRIIEQEVNQRSLSRKADISKVLFDRKLSKLLEQANFYDGEMADLCKDELTPHLQQLQRIKQDNVSIHRDLLVGLTALIN